MKKIRVTLVCMLFSTFVCGSENVHVPVELPVKNQRSIAEIQTRIAGLENGISQLNEHIKYLELLAAVNANSDDAKKDNSFASSFYRLFVNQSIEKEFYRDHFMVATAKLLIFQDKAELQARTSLSGIMQWSYEDAMVYGETNPILVGGSLTMAAVVAIAASYYAYTQYFTKAQDSQDAATQKNVDTKSSESDSN